MARKIKQYSMDDYEFVKKVLEDNKIDSKLLAKYAVTKKLRYLRHAQRIECTDEEIVAVVNGELDRKTLRHGVNYVEGDLDLPWEK